MSSTDKSPLSPAAANFPGNIPNADSDVISREILSDGCFVEVEEGVEGLVHVSEMDWTNKNIHPSKVVNVGDTVQVQVLDIDEEKRRISLGLKQCKPNPWEQFAATHNKGDKVSGKIKSITDFGIFVGLDGGIDGVVSRAADAHNHYSANVSAKIISEHIVFSYPLI